MTRPVDAKGRLPAPGGGKSWKDPATGLPSGRSEEGAMVKNKRVTLPADPADPEDFDVIPAAIERAKRSRVIRMTRAALGLSQVEFADRFHVPVHTLRAWEQAKETAPNFAVAYIRVIAQHPALVAQTLARGIASISSRPYDGSHLSAPKTKRNQKTSARRSQFLRRITPRMPPPPRKDPHRGASSRDLFRRRCPADQREGCLAL